MAPDQFEDSINQKYDKVYSAINLIWEKLHSYSEDSLGGRIGSGQLEENDNEYEAEWMEICLAMAIIRDNINIDS